MSVHGEYARALGGVIDALAPFDAPHAARETALPPAPGSPPDLPSSDAFARTWHRAFEAARFDETRDLSSAARAALGLLATLESGLTVRAAPAMAVEIDRLCAACQHLRAHCHAILGVGR